LPEIALGVSGALAYFAVRGLMSSSATDAVRHAHSLVRFEQAWGFYWEPAWQGAVTRHQAFVTAVNWVYMYGHWPFIAAVAVWLMKYRHRTYLIYRNAFFISGAVGLLFFVLYPVAPPRLADLHFVDTITLHSNSYRVLQPPSLTNQYAAFPSLHFGWNLLTGVALFRTGTHRGVRAAGVVTPLLMLFAIVATANHYLVDAVAGGALSLAALAVAERIAPPAGAPPGRTRIT
jgi:hypothetical protein